jgi:hypothetical protein
MGGHEHHIQCMAFEILRWFLIHPVTCSKEPPQFVPLIRRLEALPAIRNMMPYSDVQLAKALVLARAGVRRWSCAGAAAACAGRRRARLGCRRRVT